MNRSICVCVIGVLLSAGCGSDTARDAQPWRIDEDAPDLAVPSVEEMTPPAEEDMAQVEPEPEPFPVRPVTLKSCNPAFRTGMVWREVRDQQAALEESRWIAMLFTSRYDELVYDASFQDDYPYDEQLATLYEELRRRDIEVLLEEEQHELVVRGRPADILTLIEESCLVSAFDLTGFHCDCAAQMCEQASSCSFARAAIDPRRTGPNDSGGYERSEFDSYYTPGIANRSIIGCQGDIEFSLNYDYGRVVDFRGTGWGVSGGTSVASWQESTCPTSLNREP